MNDENTYRITTPTGMFKAVFGEGNAPVEFVGDVDVIESFKLWLSSSMLSRNDGYLITLDSLEPEDLYKFCQPIGSGITVIPPLDDLIAYSHEELAQEKSNETALDSVSIQELNTMATITGVEKLNLVKELDGLRSRMKDVISGLEKLEVIKRIGEIRAVFGTGNGQITNTEPVDIATANYLFGTQIKTAASAMNDNNNKPVDNGTITPVVNDTPPSQDNPIKAAFEAELSAIGMETDAETFLVKLESIVDRIEKAGLLEEMDGIVNEVADKLTDILAEAEKG